MIYLLKRVFTKPEILLNYVKEHPDATLNEVAEEFSVYLGKIETSKKTLLYVERDEKKRASFREERALINPNRLIYIDQSGFDEKLRRDYARAPRGEQIVVDVKGKRAQRINIIAGLFNHQLIAPFIF